MSHLCQSGINAIGTTRRKASLGESQIYLDLSEGIESFQYSESIDVAVICAGVTKLDECRKNPKLSYLVNVKNTLELVKQFLANGTFVVYLSTNHVFDGSVPYQLPDAPYEAKTEYGLQKVTVEKQIRKFYDSVCIIRLTKVLGSSSPLINKWINSMQAGKTIHPFSDMVMAPLPLTFVTLVLAFIALERIPGIIHLSGEKDISYAQAAILCAEKWDLPRTLIKPTSAVQSGYDEYIPKNTTLNIDRLLFELGFVPPTVRSTIEEACQA